MAKQDSKKAWESFTTDVRSLLDAVGTVARDARVREGTRQAARSFGSALGKTLREVGDEVEKAVRRPPPPSGR